MQEQVSRNICECYALGAENAQLSFFNTGYRAGELTALSHNARSIVLTYRMLTASSLSAHCTLGHV